MTETKVEESGQECQFDRTVQNVYIEYLYNKLVSEINKDRWKFDTETGDFYTLGHPASGISKYVVPESVTMKNALPIQSISGITNFDEFLKYIKSESKIGFDAKNFLETASIRARFINTWRLVRIKLRPDNNIYELTIVAPSIKKDTSAELTFPLTENGYLEICLEPGREKNATICQAYPILDFIKQAIEPRIARGWKLSTRKSGRHAVYDYTVTKNDEAIQVESFFDPSNQFVWSYSFFPWLTKISRYMIGQPNSRPEDDIWQLTFSFSKTPLEAPGASLKWFENIKSAIRQNEVYYGTSDLVIYYCPGGNPKYHPTFGDYGRGVEGDITPTPTR